LESFSNDFKHTKAVPTKTTKPKKGTKMKNVIVLINVLLITLAAAAGTDIIYNGSHNYEQVVAGSIYFPGHGTVDAWSVCYDNVNHLFKTTIPASTIETCSYKGLIPSRCTQEGGRIISTPVPAQNLSAPEVISIQKCLRYDYSESVSPKCAQYETISKRQPVDYTFMKYEVEIRPVNYNDPYTYEVRNMSFCN
jgi:hypothetical protein